MKSLAFAGALLCVLSIDAEARQPHRTISCVETGSVMAPVCMGRDSNPFSGARSIRVRMHRDRQAANPRPRLARQTTSEVVSHPIGCPAIAFCGCGAAVHIFGRPVRELWLAANWFKFPRAAPGAGMVAVRNHHVMVLETNLGGGVWWVFDANSGRHLTRIHARSIAGYVIVNPHGAA
jgi:hypothetical protein